MSKERRKLGQGQNLREILEGRGSQKSLRMMRERLKENLSSVVASKPGSRSMKEGEIKYYQMFALYYTICLPPRKEASPITA